MADITLGDGREITFDLSKITVLEYETLLSRGLDRKQEKEILAAPCGLTVEEINILSLKDYKRLAVAFVKKAIGPIDDEASEKN